MDHFHYHHRVLHCEEVPVSDLADVYGTPLFVYSKRTLLHHLSQLQRAFADVQPLICYSLKTNPNLSICRLMAEAGAGFDVTSGGELYRALKAGGTGDKIVFAGVGKTDRGAAPWPRVRRLDVQRRKRGRAAGPGGTGPSDEQDGLGGASRQPGPAAEDSRQDGYERQRREVRTRHRQLARLRRAAWLAIRTSGSSACTCTWARPFWRRSHIERGWRKGKCSWPDLRQQGHPVTHLNMGGGFGIHYRKQEALPADAFAKVIVPTVQALGCRLVLEPGRFIVGNAGILVSRVVYTKDSGGRHIVIQDAAMNDLIRPTLYDSFHRIWPVAPPDGFPAPPEDYEVNMAGARKSDVVGPVCESGDFLAKDRLLPPVERGDLLATFSAGAYGMAMSSNYNGRLRAAEVLVDGDQHRLIRRRETYADLVRTEVEI